MKKEQLNVLVDVELRNYYVLLKEQTNIPMSTLVERAMKDYRDKITKDGNRLLFSVSRPINK